MNTRKIVPILIAVVLIAFGVGFMSLIYNDGYRSVSPSSGNLFNIRSKDSIVKIDTNGIEVRDGEDHVVIGWDGIDVKGDGDKISIGWNGIKIKDGNSISFNNKGWSWFNTGSKNTKWETIDEERFSDIIGVSNINISSQFIDIKVKSEDRQDVGVKYHGSMKTNVVPELIVEKTFNELKIELKHSSTSYTVQEADIVLEVMIPKSYNNDLKISSSSGDADIKGLNGSYLNISSSSGNLELENIQSKSLNLATSSGDIIIEDSTGELNIATSSGNIIIDPNSNENMNIATKSGDVSIELEDKASYSISISTSSGDIIPSSNMTIVENQKNKFRATVGSGEKTISISTSSGDIIFD